MTIREQITQAYLGGASINDLVTQFNIPYAKVYRVVNEANESDDLMAELSANLKRSQNEVDRLKMEVNRSRTEVGRVKTELAKMTDLFERGKSDNLRLIIKVHRVTKSLETVRLQNEELKVAQDELLCQESKALGWAAWEGKNGQTHSDLSPLLGAFFSRASRATVIIEEK